MLKMAPKQQIGGIPYHAVHVNIQLITYSHPVKYIFMRNGKIIIPAHAVLLLPVSDRENRPAFCEGEERNWAAFELFSK